MERYSHRSWSHLLRLHRLRCRLHRSPGVQKPSARHALRDSRLPPPLHRPLHSRLPCPHRNRPLQGPRCPRPRRLSHRSCRGRPPLARTPRPVGRHRRPQLRGPRHDDGSAAYLLLHGQGRTSPKKLRPTSPQIRNSARHHHHHRPIRRIHGGSPSHRRSRRTRLHRHPPRLHHRLPQHPGSSENPPQRRAPLPLPFSSLGPDCRRFGLPSSNDRPALRHLDPPHRLVGHRLSYLLSLRHPPQPPELTREKLNQFTGQKSKRPQFSHVAPAFPDLAAMAEPWVSFI